MVFDPRKPVDLEEALHYWPVGLTADNRPVFELRAEIDVELHNFGGQRIAVACRTDAPIGLLEIQFPFVWSISFNFEYPQAEFSALIDRQERHGLPALLALRREVDRVLSRRLRALAAPIAHWHVRQAGLRLEPIPDPVEVLETAEARRPLPRPPRFRSAHFDGKQLLSGSRYREGLKPGRVGWINVNWTPEPADLPESRLTDALREALEDATAIAALLRYRHEITSAIDRNVWGAHASLKARRPGRPALDTSDLIEALEAVITAFQTEADVKAALLEAVRRVPGINSVSGLEERLRTAFQRAGVRYSRKRLSPDLLQTVLDRIFR